MGYLGTSDHGPDQSDLTTSANTQAPAQWQTQAPSGTGTMAASIFHVFEDSSIVLVRLSDENHRVTKTTVFAACFFGCWLVGQLVV